MTRTAALQSPPEAGYLQSLRLRFPACSLGRCGIVLGCVSGVPVLLAAGFAWWKDPGSATTLVVTGCGLAAALGWVGTCLLLRALGAELRSIAAEGMSRPARRHPIREVAQLAAASQAATLALRAVHASTLRTEEAERRRLARELHDELGQELVLLHMWLQKVRGTGIDPGTRAQVLQDCEALAGGVLERVRSMALDLRPAQLDDLGLPAALRALARRVGKQTGITVTLLAVPQTVQRLAEATETALYRIAQAAVTNAVRHAGASTLWIALEEQDGLATVKVQDDGCGFDLESVSARSQSGGGMGLRVMQERVQALGGTLVILTAPGTGTLVKASFPLELAENP